LYRQKADELGAAAAERLTHYQRQQDPSDKVAALANAIVYTEIQLGDEDA
jgi:hypothetical protein